MKKGIVLLITLFFIAAMSILILTNIKDTHSYINENYSKFNKAQSLYLIKNLQSSVSEKLNSIKDKEDIKEYIENNFSKDIPFNIEGIKLIFNIKPYDKYNINKLTSGTEESTNIESELITEDIYEISVLKQLLKNNIINSMKKFNDLLYKYEKITQNRKIYNLVNKFGFVDDTNKKLYELTIKIDNLDELLTAYYILDGDGKVDYFETNFK